MISRRILVTGAAGYIGSVLVRQLLAGGYTVYGLDCLLFGDDGIQELYDDPHFKFTRADIREAASYAPLLAEVDSIIHLAAIVGDPACNKSPELAKETNLEASKRLLEAAQRISSVKRFVFVSTCSNYGLRQGVEYCAEDSPLDPLSLYAETKVAFEKEVLAASTRRDFVPTVLRFATAYGLSPRMRFDLTVNEFTREVALGEELVIYGKQFWRPYCHTQDLARACIRVVESEPNAVDHQVFNVGSTSENYTKKQLADLLLELKPEARIKYIPKIVDRRDYKVNFDRIKNRLGLTTSKTVRDGITEIFDALGTGRFAAPYAAEFSNS